MIRSPNYLISAILLAAVQPVFATYLRMIPRCVQQMDTRRKTLTLRWEIKNDGDELARDVALEFPGLNQSIPLAEELGTQQTTTYTLVLPFRQLGIEKNGVYFLVYRVAYKDANLYPFSSANTLRVVLPPERISVLRIRVGTSTPSILLPLFWTRSLRLHLRNAGDTDVVIDSVEPMFPAEIDFYYAGIDVPLVLRPREEKAMTLSVRTEQSLVGSTYALGVVVSGTTGGGHFSEIGTFQIRVKEKLLNPRNLFAIALLALGVILGLTRLVSVRLPKKS